MTEPLSYLPPPALVEVIASYGILEIPDGKNESFFTPPLKNKIAPNSFIQMFYDNDIPMAIADVEDFANAIFKAVTISGLHGKNYLLSSETYAVSDLSLMLNYKMPVNTAHIVYKNQLAVNDLHIKFKPVKENLYNYNLN